MYFFLSICYDGKILKTILNFDSILPNEGAFPQLKMSRGKSKCRNHISFGKHFCQRTLKKSAQCRLLLQYT